MKGCASGLRPFSILRKSYCSVGSLFGKLFELKKKVSC